MLLITAMVIALGLFSIKQTPVDAIPDLSDVQVIINGPTNDMQDHGAPSSIIDKATITKSPSIISKVNSILLFA